MTPSERYSVSVTLRTGESPIEVVYAESPFQAIDIALDRWGELAVEVDVTIENE